MFFLHFFYKKPKEVLTYSLPLPVTEQHLDSTHLEEAASSQNEICHLLCSQCQTDYHSRILRIEMLVVATNSLT
jgi:hypothetical protein